LRLKDLGAICAAKHDDTLAGVETSSLMFITISESQAGRRPIWTTASKPGTVLRIVHRLSTSQRQWTGDGATCVGVSCSFAILAELVGAWALNCYLTKAFCVTMNRSGNSLLRIWPLKIAFA
jgi:hypothetical protein